MTFENFEHSEIEDILFERNGNEIGFTKKLYYSLKPIIPRFLQIYLRQKSANNVQHNGYEGVESIYRGILKDELRESGEKVDFIWFWRKGYNMASVLTHDVETDEGLKNVLKLAEIDEKYGIRSSFEFVPQRYKIDYGILDELKDRGFEVAIHGLKHDGKLLNSEIVFKDRLSRIQKYAEQWGAEGFRSPSLLRNASWMENFDFVWDSSFPDWDPYGPQPGGSRTIFPFFISDKTVELPVTMVQDHTLFEILGKEDIGIWKEKVEHIESLNGLANIIVHPDYILKGKRMEYYSQYLEYLKSKKKIWHSLPRDVADWWKRRDKSQIKFSSDGHPYIEGPAAEDGVIATAELVDDRLDLTIAQK